MEQFLRVNITGDASKLQRSLKGASNSLKSFGSKLTSIGTSLSLRVTAPLGLAGGAAIKMASDFQESLNKVDVAFKGSSKEVKDFAKTTLREFGIARGTALDMAALFGDMATSMGLTTGEAANMSTSLVGLAGDLASFKNMNIEEVTTALNGVFTGETESLKRLGIVMTEVNLKHFALQQGIQKSYKEMTQAEKVSLRFQYVLSKTKNAQGDFARTSGGAANQMRIFQETLKEIGASFGQTILPMFTKLISKANGMLQAFQGLSPEAKALSVTIAALAAATPILVTAFGYLTTALGAILTPVGLVVAGLTGIAYVIYKNWNEVLPVLVNFYNMFIDIYNSSKLVRVAIFGLRSAFKAVFIFARSQVAKLINRFSTMWKLIKEFSEKRFSGDFTKILKDGFEESQQITKDAAKEIAETFSDGYEDALSSTLEYATVEGVKKGFSDAAGKVKSMAQDLGKSLGITSGGGGDTTSATPAAAPAAAANEMFDPNSVEYIDIGAEESLKEDMDSMEALIQKMKLMKQVGQQVGQGLADTFSNLGQSIVSSMNLGEGALGTFVGTFITTAMDIIGAALATAAANAIASGTAGAAAAGPLAPIVLPALIAGALAAVNSAISSDVPALASGGIAKAPTLAMVGDNYGANRGNPEVIAPLNKLQGMMAGGNRNINVGGEFRVQGQDLVVALQRAERHRKRIL